eukprot:2873714-Pleurochrysis_carterae.AAC.1
MASGTHKAHPPFATRGSCATLCGPTGATATAAWCAVATRKGEAHASSVLTGSARASRRAAHAEAVSEARRDARPPSDTNPNMRSPEA